MRSGPQGVGAGRSRANGATVVLVVLVALGGAGTSTPLQAAGAAEAVQTLATRVSGSMELYKEQSARIADEKIPLLREINRLEDENIVLREQIDAALRLTSENNKDHDALRNRLEQLKAQTDFAQRFLQEYLDSFEKRLTIAEDAHYKDRLTTIRQALDRPALAPAARFEQHLAALALGLGRAEEVIGGYRFDGRAVAPGGVLAEGTIAVAGPAAYFSNARAGGGDLAGLLRFHAGTLEPAVVLLAGTPAEAIHRFMREQGDALPLDPSLGNAISLRASKVRIVDHIRQGGPVGYAILVLGAIALVLSVIKVIDLGRFRPVDSATIAAIVHTARTAGPEAALAEVRKVRGAVAEMLELGVQNIRANAVLLEEMLLSVILRKRPEIERYLPFLAITIAAAPLLGLLGTVTGMIRTFALITVFGTDDPSALSGGISEALVTTELGLMIAVPTLVIHALLNRMSKSRLSDMERVAIEFVRTNSVEEAKTRAG